MGQVVGKVSDIFRCNLAAIQSGGSKANTILAVDEVWLVDTTNSLTNSLSGNCDAYIVGDGSTKAIHLVAHMLLPILKSEIDLSGIAERNATLLSTNKWGTNTYYRHIIYPVSEGERFILKGNGDKGSYYAFLTSDALTMGADAPVLSGTTRISIAATDERVINIPAGCSYLYLYKRYAETGNISITLPLLYAFSSLEDSIQTFIRNDNQEMSDSEKRQARQNIGLGNGNIDSTPDPMSENVVTSKGIADAIDGVVGRDANYNSPGMYVSGGSIKTGSENADIPNWGYSLEYIPFNNGDVVTICFARYYAGAYAQVYNSEKVRQKEYSANAATIPYKRSFTASYDGYLRVSFGLAEKDNAYVAINGVVVWKPISAIEGRIHAVSVVDNLNSTSTEDALSANKGRELDVNKRFTLIGNNTNLVSKYYYGVLLPGHTYRIFLLNKDFDVSGDTAATSHDRLSVSYKRAEDDSYTERVNVQSSGTLQDFYDFRVSGPTNSPSDTILRIRIRATKDVPVYFYLLDITPTSAIPDSKLYKTVLELNPDREMYPKMIALAKKDTDAPSSRKNVILAHASDMHGNSTAYDRFIDFAIRWKDRGYVNDIIDTGDVLAETYNSDISWRTSLSNIEKVLTVVGNHDTAESYDNDAWQTHVGTDIYNKIIGPYVSNWGVTQPANAAENGYCYYYKDYASSYLRLVFVDIMGYDATQETWLQGVLSDARTNNYHVAIVTHFCGEVMTPISCNYTSLYGMGSSRASIDTYNSYAHNLPVSVKAFQDAGGIFVGYISGHFHRDAIAYVNDYPNQLVFGVDSGGVVTVRDFTKESGTKTYDSFQFVSIDTYKRLVKLVKVGCDTDIYMRKKGTISVSYDTHSVIGEGY